MKLWPSSNGGGVTALICPTFIVLRDGTGLHLPSELSHPFSKDMNALTLRNQVNSAYFLPWKMKQVQNAGACVLLVKQGFVQRL